MAALLLSARPIIYTLVERTRKASVIAIIKVDELQANSVTATVVKTLKGNLAQPTIQVMWNRRDKTEFSSPRYHAGEQLLIFGNPSGNMLQLLGEGSSNVSGQKEDIEQYKRAIGQILRFDGSSGDVNKKAILEEMLDPNTPVSNEAAIMIMLRDIEFKTFQGDDLIQPLVSLTKSDQRKIAVQATQVLGRIRSKAIIPPLIELLGASDSYVSETAAALVKERTGLTFDFNTRAPVNDRAAQAKKLAQWWEQNKEKTDLRF
jgi:hypothetical protein